MSSLPASARAGRSKLASAAPAPLDDPRSGARFWRVKSFARDRGALVSGLFLLAVVLAVLFAPLIAHYGPDEAENLARYKPIGTPGHILGTDQQGRDMLARLLFGGRVSLLVGVVPTLVAGAIGLGLGLTAGFVRGLVDQIIMRCLDVVFAFPMVLLAIAIAGSMRPGVLTEILAITIVLIPYFARLARTATEGVMPMPFIEAARAAGGAPMTIMVRYVLPNVFSPVVVYATTLMGLMIVVGSGLSFLGLGVQPPTADWGVMVSNGEAGVLQGYPLESLSAGLCIVCVVVAVNLLGERMAERGERKLS
jgi:ABC-type dipeptide/oligopeptide/nickel transport system permease subunit